QAPDRRPIQSWRRLHISAAKSFHHAALHAALEHGDLNHRLLSLSKGHALTQSLIRERVS
ncbi:MAG: hypothetical protein ACRD3N_14225, partial [Terracidiphilus sp.]